jgi:NADPH:quinone reductase-like Zn-dependent oxidoreductase
MPSLTTPGWEEQRLSQCFARELRSLITSEGRLQLSIEQIPIGEVADDEVVVRIEAAPLNPSDILNLLGAADLSTLKVVGDRTEAAVPKARLPGL